MKDATRPVRTVVRELSSKLQPTSEQLYFETASRCPRCRRLLLYSRTYEYGGKVKRIRTPRDPAALAECPRCNGRWFYYEQPTVTEFVETHQTVEVIRTEEMHFDNVRATSPLRRTDTVTEEWAQSYDLEVEQTAAEGTKLSLGLEKGPSVDVTAEQSLKQRFAISEQKRRTFTQEIPIEVPPGVKRTVILTFKRIWQHGTISLRPAEGPSITMPFKVVINVRMDQAQVDDPPG